MTLSRIAAIIEAKINAILERFEDPREQLDYAYEKQLQYLHKLEISIADVATAKKRLEYQRNRLLERAKDYREQAERALKANREDLAMMALERKKTAEMEAERLEEKIKDLEEDLEKLKETREKLKVKIEEFRTKKEVLKAEYDAAKAQVAIKESLTGVTKDAANAAAIIRRAEDKVEKMKARAEAIDELIATGGLIDVLEPEDRDLIERELAKEEVKLSAELELAELKKELGTADEAAKGEA